MIALRASKRMRKPERNSVGDLVEIDQLLHQLRVIGDGIDHLDRHVADLGFADAAEIDVRRIDDVVFGDARSRA